MAEEYVICNKSDLVSVADAIRTKSSTSGDMSFPQDFVDGVSGIEAGGGKQYNKVAKMTIKYTGNAIVSIHGIITDENGYFIQDSMAQIPNGQSMYVADKTYLYIICSSFFGAPSITNVNSDGFDYTVINGETSSNGILIYVYQSNVIKDREITFNVG